MLLSHRASLLAGLFLVVACTKAKDDSSVTPEPDANVEGEVAPKDDASSRPEFAGVAHSGSIDLVVLDPGGKVALTRDVVGGLRLWPALDGSLEPQAVPIASPRSMAVLAHEGAFVVFAVESSGGGRFVSMKPNGHANDIAALPPFNPVLQVVSLQGADGGRFVALMHDGSLHVFDPRGKVLSVFDEKGFQPMEVRPSGDGKHLVTVYTMDRVGSDNRAEVQRLTFGGAAEAPTLQRTGAPRIVTATTVIGDTTLAVSPDATEISILARAVADHWDVEIYDLGTDTKPRKVEVKFSMHQQPHLGYTGVHRLLISSNEGTPSQLLDTATEGVRLRTAIPSDFNHQGRAQASAAGRQIVGYGSFLFVHDVDAREHRFLGYQANQGSSVGISPSGVHVAWAHSQGPVVVEQTDGRGTAMEIEYGTNNFSGTRVRFLDEEHLIIVDAVGEVSLVHWSSQEVVAHAGTMSNVRAVHLDAGQGVLVLERYTNEAWVYEVSVEEGFKGPYIVGDTYRLGILRPTPPSDAVLWSLQSTNNKTREFTLDQLRADLTVAEADALGIELEAGQSPPLAVDPVGRHYGVRWNGTALELFVRMGKEVVASKSLPSNDINQVVPSPQGDRFLAVINRAGAISVTMYDSETLASLWSYSTGVFNTDTAWSDDGRYVAFSAATGAVLLDAATGEPVMSRCGLRFSSSSAPPSTAFSTPNQKSICEL